MSIFFRRAALLACLQLASAALQCPYMQGRGASSLVPRALDRPHRPQLRRLRDLDGSGPVGERRLVRHLAPVPPQQLVEVATTRRVAEVRVHQRVRLLGDPRRLRAQRLGVLCMDVKLAAPTPRLIIAAALGVLEPPTPDRLVRQLVDDAKAHGDHAPFVVARCCRRRPPLRRCGSP